MRLLLLLLVTIPAWAQFGAARQVVNGNGAPSASLCASSNNVGLVYARKDGEAAYSTFYVCANTAAATYEWELMGAGGGGGGVSSVSATGGVQTSSGAAITSTGTVRGAYVANAQTGTTYTVLTGDRGKVVTFSNAGAIAVTLPQAGTGFEDGWFVIVKNIGAGDVTITPTTSTISGAASIVLSLGEFALITSNGTNYESVTNRVRVDSSLTKTASRSAGVELGAGPSLVTLTGSQTLTDKRMDDSSNSIGPNAIKNYGSGSGSAQAQEATLSPGLPSYIAGSLVCWLPAATNTGPGTTLDVDGLGTKTITKFGTTPLVAGDITINTVACAIYDGTRFQLQNPQSFLQFTTFVAANCQGTSAFTSFATPTANAPAATCVTGTNTNYATLDFDAATDESVQYHFPLASDWTGSIDLTFRWRAAATSGDVVWAVQTICVADGETGDPAFNTASTVTDTAKGTTLQWNDASISSITVTGCAAGEELMFKLYRDADAGGDTMTGDAQLIWARFTTRRAQ